MMLLGDQSVLPKLDSKTSVTPSPLNKAFYILKDFPLIVLWDGCFVDLILKTVFWQIPRKKIYF
jgi:hypothetical protein